MAPFYEEICQEQSWTIDQNLLQSMKEANETELKKLDEQINDAEQNLGETEVRDFMLKKAEYLCKIGAKVKEKFMLKKAEYGRQVKKTHVLLLWVRPLLFQSSLQIIKIYSQN